MIVKYNSVLDDIVDAEMDANINNRTINYIKVTKKEYKEIRLELLPIGTVEYNPTGNLGKISGVDIVGMNYRG